MINSKVSAREDKERIREKMLLEAKSCPYPFSYESVDSEYDNLVILVHKDCRGPRKIDLVPPNDSKQLRDEFEEFYANLQ